MERFDKARRALREAVTVDDVKDVRDKAEAIRMYLKQSGDSLDMQNMAASLKLRAERRGGELLRDMEKHNGRPKNGSSVEPLSDIGIGKTQSHRWQRLASIPETEFEAFIESTTSASQELTTAGALRLAKRTEHVARDESLTQQLQDLGELENGHFATIYADPPWQYGNQSTRAATDNHYPTMPIDDICALPVKDIAADTALLFLWTTTSFIEPALTRVIPEWGFTYKSMIVWTKPQMGIGNYVRVSHELLLIANRGGMQTTGTSQMSWVEANRTKHSRKPDKFRHIVEALAPGPRLEMFAREKFTEWSTWGNERINEAKLFS